MKTMAELEAENPEGFRNPSRTPAEQAEIDRRTQAMREHDKTHTSIDNGESDEDEQE